MDPKIKITLIMSSYSGSNTSILYRYLPKHLADKYDVQLVNHHLSHQNKDFDHSDVYITTHGERYTHPHKMNFEFWHGFPLKAMALMDKGESVDDEHIITYWKNLNKIASYSPLYNTLMNACNGTRIEKYEITGMPRNDALLNNSQTKEMMHQFFPDSKNKNIIFFMPTFRKSSVTPEEIDGNKSDSNFFGFESLNLKEFVDFLSDSNSILIVKLHPSEEKLFLDSFSELQCNEIQLLTDEMLSDNNTDLYDLLGSVDLLITDYSSVYFDFLLLNRPIIFTPVDIEDYRQNRGFLLEPYEFWAPGFQALNQTELIEAISKSLDDPSLYTKERESILQLVHTHTDNLSSQRSWEMIDVYLTQHQQELLEQQQMTSENRKLQENIKKEIYKLVEQGELSKAHSAINAYIENAGVDSDIFSLLGIVQFTQGYAEEAIVTLEKGTSFFPDDPDLVYNLAYVLEASGNADKALDYYKKVLTMNPNPEILNNVQERLTINHTEE